MSYSQYLSGNPLERKQLMGSGKIGPYQTRSRTKTTSFTQSDRFYPPSECITGSSEIHFHEFPLSPNSLFSKIIHASIVLFFSCLCLCLPNNAVKISICEFKHK